MTGFNIAVTSAFSLASRRRRRRHTIRQNVERSFPRAKSRQARDELLFLNDDNIAHTCLFHHPQATLRSRSAEPGRAAPVKFDSVALTSRSSARFTPP